MTLLASSSLFTSCVAKSRLGMFIPGHIRSNQSKGEVVTARYYMLQEAPKAESLPPPPSKAGDGAQKTGLEAAAAAFLAGLVIDTTKKELLKEAESYEHGYATRLMLTTQELGGEGIIVLTRWIDEPKKTAAASPDKSDLSDKLIPAEDNQLITISAPKSAIEQTLKNPPPGKVPAAIMTMRVKAHGNTGVYRLSGAKLWVDRVGSKVVSFGWANAAQPWQWLGGLILATDGQAEIAANMKVKALTKNKDGEGAWIEIKPESSVLGSTKVGLSKLPATFALGNNVGSWMAVPSYDKVSQLGFVVMEFDFVEKDTSNTKKYLTKAADSVEGQRGKLTDLIENAIGN
jgi:hypothetical protein